MNIIIIIVSTPVVGPCVSEVSGLGGLNGP
jgi:hypothetical protein